MDLVADLRERWIGGYDFRAAEALLNAHPQFMVSVEGQDIHFYWVRGSGPSAAPLVLTHGWPGSVAEFVPVLDALAHPERHGGDARDAFDVVVPSLPGFGFSAPPSDVLGPRTTARLWRTLMTEVLGYSRFFAQGGDLGAMVAAYLAGEHPDVVSAIHLNFVPVRPHLDEELTEDERAWKREAAVYRTNELDYFWLQAHRPQTLAVALQDSPLGAAAWMLEKFDVWSDGGVAQAFRMDDLITNMMLYVATGSVASSLWYYRNFLLECGGRMHPGSFIEVPTGVAVFPHDMLIGRPPRRWVERDYDLVRWTELQRGGHFACLEQPEAFVKDVRDFFRTQRR